MNISESERGNHTPVSIVFATQCNLLSSSLNTLPNSSHPFFKNADTHQSLKIVQTVMNCRKKIISIVERACAELSLHVGK
jgi:hypothetical protein